MLTAKQSVLFDPQALLEVTKHLDNPTPPKSLRPVRTRNLIVQEELDRARRAKDESQSVLGCDAIGPTMKNPHIAQEKQFPKNAGAVGPVVEDELAMVRVAWKGYQSTRRRDAVYDYLGAVFKIARRWKKEQRTKASMHQALRAIGQTSATRNHEAFTTVILCTSDPCKVDTKTRSKWSRALRFAERSMPDTENLSKFMQRLGGINACADRFPSRER
jgi:hypothetical protein